MAKNKAKETEENKKQEHSLVACMIVQQLKDEYWWWAAKAPTPPTIGDDEEYNARERERYDNDMAVHKKLKMALAMARGGDVSLLVKWVAERLGHCGLYELHGILHNQDKAPIWDEAKKDYVQVLKNTEAHILVRFTPSEEYNADRTIPSIAAAVGVEEQYVERPKQGRYAVDNMLAYLIHIKDKDKHQYSPDEVFTFIPEGSGGEKYTDIYARRRQSWMRGRGIKSKKKADVDVELLVDEISLGRVTKQQILLTNDLYAVYCRNRRKINDAFSSLLERKVLEVANDMKLGKFRLSVFFITGEAGHGKSLFADFFATGLQRYQKETNNEDWQVYDAAATNSMDDYIGEEILILDDLRAGAMRAEDWLRLLDNHRTRSASARFYNKTPICKTLIITSEKDPFRFFDDCARTNSEDLNQFIRRITACVEVVNMSEIFNDAQFSIGEVKKVEPYQYGNNEKPLVYKFKDDNRVYSPVDAVRRLLGIVKKASAPAASPFPEGWEKAIMEPLEEPEEQAEMVQDELSF